MCRGAVSARCCTCKWAKLSHLEIITDIMGVTSSSFTKCVTKMLVHTRITKMEFDSYSDKVLALIEGVAEFGSRPSLYLSAACGITTYRSQPRYPLAASGYKAIIMSLVVI